MRAWMRTNLIALVALFVALAAGLGTTAVASVAKNSVTSASIKNNAVKSVDVKKNSLTGKDIKESKLGTVPDATRVGGLKLATFERSLPVGPAEVTLLIDSGDRVSAFCTGDQVAFLARRPVGGAPMLVQASRPGEEPFIDVAPEGIVYDFSDPGGQYTFTILKPGRGSTRLDIAAVFEADAGTGTDDCLLRGTFAKTP